MRSAFLRLCPILLALVALACQEEAPEAPAAPGAGGAAALPNWAEHLCEDWAWRDGSCDQARIMADYEECFRTQGAPESARMRERGVGNRAVQRAGVRNTNLCLELRQWRMTPKGLEKWQGSARRAAPPS